MSGQQLETSALLLSRSPSGSDFFEQLVSFSVEHGLLLCLRRLKKKKTAPDTIPLDLFDEVELSLESSNQGRVWFIKEYRHLARHPQLGRSYTVLQTAANLAQLIIRNPVSDESRPAVFVLLHQSLAALEAGAPSGLVWLKSLYCFARDEGYPVKQQWWPQLSAILRIHVAQFLNKPAAVQAPDIEQLDAATRNLEHWLAAETEVKLQ